MGCRGNFVVRRTELEEHPVCVWLDVYELTIRQEKND